MEQDRQILVEWINYNRRIEISNGRRVDDEGVFRVTGEVAELDDPLIIFFLIITLLFYFFFIVFFFFCLFLSFFSHRVLGDGLLAFSSSIVVGGRNVGELEMLAH